MDLINHLEAAKLLGIPEIAIGQCVFDGKLMNIGDFCFDRSDVMRLKTSNSEYLKTLK